MNQNRKIVVTGAAGFIGSILVTTLNLSGYEQLILVDDFSNKDKAINLKGKKYELKVHRDQFMDWLQQHPDNDIAAVFHLGARTDTTSIDKKIFKQLNVNYSKALFEWCAEHDVPFLYASSAATYGNGEHGYNDDESSISLLRPINEYAKSKHEVDLWILAQQQKPTHWYGFKFFNVYGPNEAHKGRMASVVFHAYQEILKNGCVTLFKSHNKKYKDGEQMRDFVYVKDVCKVLLYFFENLPNNGIYNLGTGRATTFLRLVQSLFDAIGHQGDIRFKDTPEDIRDNYQYFTEANIEKLRAAGYTASFTNVQEGVKDYASEYLEAATHY